MKLLVGAVVAGIAMFAWGAVSHMLLPLGKMGLSPVPSAHEELVHQTLVTALSDRAIYFYPPLDMESPTEEQQSAYEDKVATGPSALIVYAPGPGPGFGARTLGIELGSDILACLIAGLILLQLPASVGYLRRALAVALMGAFAVVVIEVSYWNWY